MAAVAIRGERRGRGGHDLEALERLARAGPAALDGGHRVVAHVGGRGQPEHDAVGDLAGQLQHARGQPGQQDRRRGRDLREPALPVHAVARALVLHPAGQRAAQHRDVLADDLERLAHVETERALHHRAVAHPDAQAQAPAARVGEREGLLGQQHRVPRIDRDDARAEARVRGHVRVGRQRQQRVAADAVGDPEALVAQRVGAPGQGHRGRQVGAGAQEERGARHRAQAPGVTPSAASWARRSWPWSTRWSTACMPTARAASTFLSQSSTNTHASGGRPRRSAARRKISGAGLRHPDLGGDHDVVEEVVQRQLAFEPTAQREIRVAQDRAAIRGAQRAHQRDIGGDGHLGATPLVVQARQRAAGAALELPVGALRPRGRIAHAALDVSPGRAAVERLEHRGLRQAVGAVQLARDVPAHVPQDAAEVEDDGAEASSGGHAGSGRAWPARPARDRDRW